MMLNRLVRTILFLLLLLGSSIPVRAQSASVMGSKTAAASSIMDFSSAKFTPGVKTVSTLPSAASSTNAIYEVIDGTSASDCTVGSGSTRSLCASTGSVWVSVGGGSSSGASIQSLGTITTPPTLDGGNGTVKTIGAVLGANIASCAAIQNFVSGQILTLSLTQDGTGSRTFACAGLANLGTVSGQAGKNDKQTFVAVSASTLQAIAPMWCVDCPPALGLPGLTSGILNIKAAAIAGSNTLTFPAGTTDFSVTGGASQFVKQASSGGAFTVAQPSAADLSNGVSGSGAICLATGSACGGGGSSIALVQTIQSAHSVSPNAQAITWGTGHLATVVIVDDTQNNTVSSVIGSNSGSWTQACTIAVGATRLDIWYKANATSGADTVTATLSGGGGGFWQVLAEWSGAATTTPLDSCAAVSSTSSAANPFLLTGNITVTNADTLSIGAVLVGSGGPGPYNLGLGSSTANFTATYGYLGPAGIYRLTAYAASAVTAPIIAAQFHQ